MPSTPLRIRLLSSVALVAVAALTLGACSHSDKKATTTSAVPSTDAKGKPKVSLAFALGARIGLTVKGTTDQGPLSVSRIGNLVFEPDAQNHWHITGYNLVVNRDTSTASTTTTAKATTTTAAK